MNRIIIFCLLPAFVVAGRFAMHRLRGLAREATLAVLNILCLSVLFYDSGTNPAVRCAFYLALITGFYAVLKFCVRKTNGRIWWAFFAPILGLVFVRYALPTLYLKLAPLIGKTPFGQPNTTLVGISYLAFRCSRLALEIRSGAVQPPNFLEYLNFATFFPTMSVGPINSYSNFRSGFATPYLPPADRAALRILVGAVKSQFLGNLCNQLTYSALLLNSHPHHWIELPIASVAYFFYLYFNFSGYCDIAIGASALMGIAVPENFDNPLTARNPKEFWNRWHITLSSWMRDIVFSPLSKQLIHWTGPKSANHAIALSIAVLFLLVGAWHGIGWNFIAFGAFHGLGVIANHYYTLFLKKKLGRDGFKAYNDSRWIRAIAVAGTFSFCSASLIFFANSFDEIREIFASLR